VFIYEKLYEIVRQTYSKYAKMLSGKNAIAAFAPSNPTLVEQCTIHRLRSAISWTHLRGGKNRAGNFNARFYYRCGMTLAAKQTSPFNSPSCNETLTNITCLTRKKILLLKHSTTNLFTLLHILCNLQYSMYSRNGAKV